MKRSAIVLIAIIVSLLVGCASTGSGYRNNPTHNYPPRGYDGTAEGAKTQEAWAQTETKWAKAEQARASAAIKWQQAESQAVLANARATREYSKAARDVAYTVRDIRKALGKRCW